MLAAFSRVLPRSISIKLVCEVKSFHDRSPCSHSRSHAYPNETSDNYRASMLCAVLDRSESKCRDEFHQEDLLTFTEKDLKSSEWASATPWLLRNVSIHAAHQKIWWQEFQPKLDCRASFTISTVWDYLTLPFSCSSKANASSQWTWTIVDA